MSFTRPKKICVQWPVKEDPVMRSLSGIHQAALAGSAMVQRRRERLRSLANKEHTALLEAWCDGTPIIRVNPIDARDLSINGRILAILMVTEVTGYTGPPK